MAGRIRAHDWAATSLGPVAGWPAELRLAVALVLDCPSPAILAWGPSLVILCNDACRPMLAGRKALGRPFAEVWGETAPEVVRLAAQVLAGQPGFLQDVPCPAGRPGQPAFTFAGTPVRAADGGVAGVLGMILPTGLAAAALRGREARFPVSVMPGSDAAYGTNPDWSEIRHPHGRIGAAQDVADCRQAEERQGFLLKLSDRLRPLPDPAEVQRVACALLAEQLDVDRVCHALIDESAGLARITGDFARGGAAPLAGTHRLEDFGWALDTLRRGAHYGIPDTRTSTLIPDRSRKAAGSLGIIACMAVPLIQGGALVGVLGVASGRPHEWHAADVTLLGDVVERIGTAMARARAEAALRADMQRQAFLLELSDRLRSAGDARAAMAAAAGLFARRLGLSLAHFLLIRADGDRYDVAAGHSDGSLPAALGQPGRLSALGPGWAPQLRAGEAVFSDDHDARPQAGAVVQRALGIRSGSAVPLIRGGRLVAVFAAASPAPRTWTEAEKALQFEVAERSWAAVERARVEADLREREERLRAILETARDYAILTTDPEGRVETWSRGAEEVLGWSEDEIVGEVLDVTFTPEDRAAGVPAWERRTARQQGQAPDVRWHLRKDGSRVFIEGSVRPLTGPDRAVRGFVKVGQDVTERRAIQERLRANEAMFRQFGESTSDVIWIRSAQSLLFDYVSPAFETVYGAPLPALQARHDLRAWAALIHPEDRGAALANLRRVRAGERVTHEFRIRRPPDGDVRWIRNTDFPLVDAEGRVRGIAGIGQDVTALKRAQAAIAESERQLRTLAEGIPQLVWRATDRGAWSWASAQWTAFTGQPEAESHGHGWLGPLHPDDREDARAAWQQAQASGVFAAEYRLREEATGAFRWFQSRATRVRDEAGALAEWLGTSTDVQVLKEMQGRQSVLLAELQHRTRNLMAVVRAIMEATLRGHPDAEGFAAVFRGRIEALAGANRLLSRLNDGDRITFDELIRAELSALGAVDANGRGARVILDGPEGLRLRSSAVQTLALALHELATNAAKYGALTQPAGHLAVRWRHLPSDDGPRLRVEWTETGVTVPSPGVAPRGGGYGRTLIEQALPYQLGAETRYEIGPDGVCCTITMPLSSPKEP